jgi:hypothetical protein
MEQTYGGAYVIYTPKIEPTDFAQSYTDLNVYGSLVKHVPIRKLNSPFIIPDDANILLLLDFLPYSDVAVNTFKKWKDRGVKIVVAVYDPLRFVHVGMLAPLIDKLILFDQKWQNKFPDVKTYVSDYPVNEDLIQPTEQTKQGVCYFGHLEESRRDLPEGVEHIKTPPGATLYSKIQEYRGAIVFDHGLSEGGYNSPLDHYNKAKAVEVLMCGRQAYCMAGIKTKAYDDFLLPFWAYKDKLARQNSIETIRRLNQECIVNLVAEITNA